LLDVRLLKEADRHLTVCNACRYCEGVCPVFPALERRRDFTEGDIIYLGSLCHDCRDCYEVCPYSPPHELNINVPKVMAEVREQTYRSYSAPRLMGRAFAHGAPVAGLVTVVAITIVLALVVWFRSDRLLQSWTGPGAFYEVIPWLAMLVPAMAVSIYGLAILGIGLIRFWRDTDGPLAAKLDVRSLIEATTDVLVLRQMRGGGPGCTYPDQRPSHRRVVFHQLVFYGFALTFISTSLAAFTQEVMGIPPPYPFFSPVVLTGTVGGVAQVVGCAGLIALKLRATSIPASQTMLRLDFAFLLMLLGVNLTGLMLLGLRETPVMGLLLVVHLGSVAGLFITMPYGKFVHLIYRYGSLVRNRQEELRERQLLAPQ
jgi:citrate/tricarballylate utilization protein